MRARDFPWRHTRDPYRVLVAEVMLQQTGVGRVLQRYEPFLEQFPTLEALARAPTAEVIRAWTPLGYNKRAVNLQRAAQAIVAEHGGAIPQDREALRRLPGIGPYTAAALACLAFGKDVAVVDTNVRRVLGRLLVGPAPVPLEDAWRLAQAALVKGKAAAWTQALMDLAATVCLAGAPRCAACPLQGLCAAAPAYAAGPSASLRTDLTAHAVDRVAERQEVPYIGSPRYYRGRVVQALREAPGPLALAALGPRVRPGYAPKDEPWLRGLLEGLERDGLVRVDDDAASLP